MESPPKIDNIETTFQKHQHVIMFDYLPWNKLKYKLGDVSSYKEVWKKIKSMRKPSLYKVPQIKGINGSCFYINFTPKIIEYCSEVDQYTGMVTSESHRISLNKKSGFSLVVINSIMEESISSSQIEGASTSKKIAKEMIRGSKQPQDDSQKMILNDYLARRHIVDEVQKSALSHSLIKDIHSIVTKGLLNEEKCGNYRGSNDIKVYDNVTNEVLHEPPKFTEIQTLIDSLIEFANNQDKVLFIHPVVKASIIHFMIGYIHPFEDGNGRTARLLVYWYLLKEGYSIFETIIISKIIKLKVGQYQKAYLYTEHDDNDLTYFVLFHLEVISEAMKEFEEYRKRYESRLTLLRNKMRTHSERLNFNKRQEAFLINIVGNPGQIWDVKMYSNQTMIGWVTAKKDLDELAKQGFLTMLKSGKKFVYVVPDTIDEMLGSSEMLLLLGNSN
jgi:Fic family protein